MTDIPAWKQDIEHVAQIIQRQRSGPFAVCQEPLGLDVSDESVELAYDMALSVWGAKVMTDVPTLVDPTRNVENDLTKCYVNPDLAQQISSYALRDIEEIHSL